MDNIAGNDVTRVFLFLSGIVSLQLFSWNMTRRKYFLLRLMVFAAIYAGMDSLAIFLNGLMEQLAAGNAAVFVLLHGVYNIVSFLITVGALCFLYDEGPVIMLFCGVSGICTMHIAEYLSKLAFHFFFMSTLMSMGIYAVVYLTVWALYARKIRSEECEHLNNGKVIFFAFMTLMVTDVIVLGFNERNIGSTASVYIFVLVTLICVAILAVQNSLLLESQHKAEELVISQLRKKEREQYEISRETINLIGIRQHDLKNMLKSRAAGLLDGEIEDIVRSIDGYEMPFDTGNKTLDVILTEKNLTCKKKNIRFECTAEGESLGFLSDMDIYSLFLNALNNAEESADKLQDESKREIRLRCYSRGDLLFIQVQNYFLEVNRTDGDYQTTKADKNNHGFGLRSMKLIAAKYGGEMSVSTDGDIFLLGFVIPIP